MILANLTKFRIRSCMFDIYELCVDTPCKFGDQFGDLDEKLLFTYTYNRTIYVGVAQFILSSKRYQLHKVIITFGCRGPNDAEINRTGSVLPDRWCRDASAGRQSKCNGPDIIYRLRRGGGREVGGRKIWI